MANVDKVIEGLRVFEPREVDIDNTQYLYRLLDGFYDVDQRQMPADQQRTAPGAVQPSQRNWFVAHESSDQLALRGRAHSGNLVNRKLLRPGRDGLGCRRSADLAYVRAAAKVQYDCEKWHIR